MILRNAGYIGRMEMLFDVILIESFDQKHIDEAIKIINPPTMIPTPDNEKYIVYRHSSSKSIHLIVSHNDLSFNDRMNISYNVAKRFETHLHHLPFEDILSRVGGILNDAYMTITEKIIIETKNHGKD